MLTVAPGATFEATTARFAHLATVGVRIRDNAGANFLARTTGGVTEDLNVGTSAVFRRSFTAPATPGQWTIVWDDGTIIDTEELVVTAFAPSSVIGDDDVFANTDDLEARLGITLTVDEETRASALLALASGLIQNETGQTIRQVEDDALNRPGSYDNRLRLPQRPVTEVTSVSIDGDELDTTAWYLDGDEIVHRSGFSGPSHSVEVVYTHGYATVPLLVRATVIEMVVRAWVNPGSVKQEFYGSAQVTYQNTGLMLLESERKTLSDLLRRQAGSVSLR